MEAAIAGVIKEKLTDGTIEKLVEEKLTEGVSKALENVFSSYGEIMNAFSKQIKQLILPQIETHDYSEYLVKLDSVLTEAVKEVMFPHKRILENFKEFLDNEEIPKEIKSTDLWLHWLEHVAEHVETDGLDVEHDDGISYELVEVTGHVDYAKTYDWHSREEATIVFECEHDESLNVLLHLRRYDDYGPWYIDKPFEMLDMSTLRTLNTFQIYLLKAYQQGSKIVIDDEEFDDEVRPNQEPEASYD